MDEYRRNNLSLWNEYAKIHVRLPFYRVEDFLSGENVLNDLERGEMGDVEGQSLLHLQCHFGLDTLCWAKLGARVTGVDFSDEAIQQAEALANRVHLDARFLCCDVYDAPDKLKEPFDIVYTSYGVLCWLPDLTRWAQVIAHFLKPGGFFYMAEFHPFTFVFDDQADELRVKESYFNTSMMKYDVQGSYADCTAKVQTKSSYEWNHTLGEILTALTGAGLQIEFMHEFPFTYFKQLQCMNQIEPGVWGFADGSNPIPLMFSIRAVKPCC